MKYLADWNIYINRYQVVFEHLRKLLGRKSTKAVIWLQIKSELCKGLKPKMPVIYILLPVHNRRTITIKFVDSLLQQNINNYHLILIDDGSSDGTSEALKEKLSNVTILRGNGNLWWAGALQKGIDHLKRSNIAKNDVVLFINDDTYMPPNFLKTGLKNIVESTLSIAKANVFCIESKKLLEHGLIYNPITLTFNDSKHYENSNMSSSNGLFIKWKDILVIGDFKPDLLPHYLSDYEYTYRAYQKGYKIVDPRELTLLWHQEMSGFRSFTKTTIIENLQMYFSKKSAMNPIYWSTFIWLTTTGKARIRHLLINWRSAFKKILDILSNRPMHYK